MHSRPASERLVAGRIAVHFPEVRRASEQQRAAAARSVVVMRTACHARLRNAVYHWARVATQNDDIAKLCYAALRARGKSHGQALRCVADRLLNILCAMLRNQTDYREPASTVAG